MSRLRQLEYIIAMKQDGITVQDFLMKEHGFSRRIITRLKREPQHIRCNGEHIRMVDRLHACDQLVVMLTEPSHIPPNSNLSVPIVYEDEDVIVFHKPAGMPVHPSILHYEDTLANFFSYHMEQNGVQTTFRPINRLDRDTMGLCLVAKNALAAKKLCANFEKEYTAIVCGVLPLQSGEINAPIGREDGSLMKRVVRSDGQPSVTQYQVLKQEGEYTWVKVHLLTGRTHQIRVHFAHVGFPLAGDELYGGWMTEYCSQALCCSSLSFIHPMTEKKIDLRINIQNEMNKIRA